MRILLSVLIACVSLACGGDDPHGTAAKEDLAREYLRALERRDARALAQLGRGDVAASRAVQRLLQERGGRRLANVRIEFHDLEGGEHRADANCEHDDPGTGGLGGFEVHATQVAPQRRPISWLEVAYVENRRCYLGLQPDRLLPYSGPPTVEGRLP